MNWSERWRRFVEPPIDQLGYMPRAAPPLGQLRIRPPRLDWGAFGAPTLRTDQLDRVLGELREERLARERARERIRKRRLAAHLSAAFAAGCAFTAILVYLLSP